MLLDRHYPQGQKKLQPVIRGMNKPVVHKGKTKALTPFGGLGDDTESSDWAPHPLAVNKVEGSQVIKFSSPWRVRLGARVS